tara:strand:- start:3841 stop:5814 length:1974 start_codon:yes stop_codon:yes gene_type:complete
MAKDDIVEEAKEAFESVQEAEEENRENANADIRFARLGEQWDESDRNKRARDGRPTLTINRMPAFIRQVTNDARLNTPSVKVHPVDDSADPECAEILNGLIRNIQISSNADEAYDTALIDAVTGGFGYFMIDVDFAYNDTFEQDILVKRIANPFTVYGDPRSTGADSSDWNSAFITDMMSRKDFEEEFPEAEAVHWDEDFEADNDLDWITEESVRVADYWKRTQVDRPIVLLSNGEIVDEEVYGENKDYFDIQGIQVENERTVKSWKVKRYTLSGKEVLEEIDWPGMYIPIIPVYGEENWVDGKRYFKSLIRDAKDPQRIYNYWRTASTELVALAPKAPFIGPVGSFDEDGDKWATANTESHPYLQYDGQIAPQRQPFAGPPAGALQEALNASDDMKQVLGMFDASMGAPSNETSGRAIMARQREGDVSTFHFIDNLNRAIQHAGKIMLDLIPHVYSGERIVRILGEDEKPENVQVNQPIPMMDEQGQPMMDDMGQPQARIYDLTKGKYDLVVRSGPSFTSRREEAATQMMELLRVFPEAAPIIGDIFARNLDWPGADEISKRLEKITQGEPEDPEKANLVAQLQMAVDRIRQLEGDQQADAAKIQIDQQKLELDKQKVGIDQFEAETDRMEAEAEIQKDIAQAQSYSPVINYPFRG